MRDITVQPYSAHWLDKFLVVNTAKNAIVQGEFGEERANWAAKVCNDHEARNGRPPIYLNAAHPAPVAHVIVLSYSCTGRVG